MNLLYFSEEKSTNPLQTFNFYCVADYMMYEYFNETLWRKIAREGDDFWEEMNTLWEYEQTVNTYCQSVYK